MEGRRGGVVEWWSDGVLEYWSIGVCCPPTNDETPLRRPADPCPPSPYAFLGL